jgi:L-ascorbate metabolism protein UlaG (beta-lactamase superfamily)
VWDQAGVDAEGVDHGFPGLVVEVEDALVAFGRAYFSGFGLCARVGGVWER